MSTHSLLVLSALAGASALAPSAMLRPGRVAARSSRVAGICAVAVNADAIETLASAVGVSALSAGTFATLVAAVKAAGLVETLKGPGPFTVFAPTDAAFAKLPAGTLDSLLLPENKAKLAAILTYHVLPGKVMAEVYHNANGKEFVTVNGQSLKVSVSGGVKINGANVLVTDMPCLNGAIHVIDAVLIPK
ncbi:FAS1 domain-containing protein [Pavlovales sp. CCMP2436]|nr:FAS1 domain-containing protein [Pavlovales sp. CCMP2436]